MPMVDMPLEELRKYQGINPCPADLDEYWDKALEEMRAVDPKVELIPSDFKSNCAECFDMYFIGVQGARIHVKYARPKNREGKCPALLLFHGYTGSGAWWMEILPYVAEGFCVAALDCRGQGGTSEDVGGVKGTTWNGHIIRGMDDAPEKLLFRQIFLDTAELAQIVMSFDEVDEDRLAASGLSQGGGLTLACAALEPRVKRLTPCCPFLSDFKRVWEMDLCENAYAEIKYYLRWFDPLHEHIDEFFTRLGYIDVKNLVHRIRGEVLMGTGLLDTICPPSTQFAAFNRITSPKQMLIYPDYTHETPYGWWEKAFEFLSNV